MTKYRVAEIDGSFAVLADDQAVISFTTAQMADDLIDAINDKNDLDVACSQSRAPSPSSNNSDNMQPTGCIQRSDTF